MEIRSGGLQTCLWRAFSFSNAVLSLLNTIFIFPFSFTSCDTKSCQQFHAHTQWMNMAQLLKQPCLQVRNTAMSSRDYTANCGTTCQLSANQSCGVSDALPADPGLFCFSRLIVSCSLWSRKAGSCWGRGLGKRIRRKKEGVLLLQRGPGHRGISADLPAAWSSLLSR